MSVRRQRGKTAKRARLSLAQLQTSKLILGMLKVVKHFQNIMKYVLFVCWELKSQDREAHVLKYTALTVTTLESRSYVDLKLSGSEQHYAMV